MRRWLLLGSVLLVPALGAWVKVLPDASTKTASYERSEAPILGLWSRFQPTKEGDPQRFYYFHNGGIGLFRYGRMGLTYTQTFQYDLEKKVIRITFNKTGEKHDVPYVIEGDRLTLAADPKMGGAQTYTKRRFGSAPGYHAFDHPLARLWTEKTTDGKGGVGFRMYQLQAPTIDGRGVGWYHEGDFAEWSTETLQYRRTGDQLSLHFPVRNESHVTELAEGQTDGVRTLHLNEDPRNFWHPRTYLDGGPGFTMFVAQSPLPYHVPGHGAAAKRRCPHAP